MSGYSDVSHTESRKRLATDEAAAPQEPPTPITITRIRINTNTNINIIGTGTGIATTTTGITADRGVASRGRGATLVPAASPPPRRRPLLALLARVRVHVHVRARSGSLEVSPPPQVVASGPGRHSAASAKPVDVVSLLPSQLSSEELEKLTVELRKRDSAFNNAQAQTNVNPSATTYSYTRTQPLPGGPQPPTYIPANTANSRVQSPALNYARTRETASPLGRGSTTGPLAPPSTHSLQHKEKEFSSPLTQQRRTNFNSRNATPTVSRKTVTATSTVHAGGSPYESFNEALESTQTEVSRMAIAYTNPNKTPQSQILGQTTGKKPFIVGGPLSAFTRIPPTKKPNIMKTQPRKEIPTLSVIMPKAFEPPVLKATPQASAANNHSKPDTNNLVSKEPMVTENNISKYSSTPTSTPSVGTTMNKGKETASSTLPDSSSLTSDLPKPDLAYPAALIPEHYPYSKESTSSVTYTIECHGNQSSDFLNKGATPQSTISKQKIPFTAATSPSNATGSSLFPPTKATTLGKDIAVPSISPTPSASPVWSLSAPPSSVESARPIKAASPETQVSNVTVPSNSEIISVSESTNVKSNAFKAAGHNLKPTQKEPEVHLPGKLEPLNDTKDKEKDTLTTKNIFPRTNANSTDGTGFNLTPLQNPSSSSAPNSSGFTPLPTGPFGGGLSSSPLPLFAPSKDATSSIFGLKSTATETTSKPTSEATTATNVTPSPIPLSSNLSLPSTLFTSPKAPESKAASALFNPPEPVVPSPKISEKPSSTLFPNISSNIFEKTTDANPAASILNSSKGIDPASLFSPPKPVDTSVPAQTPITSNSTPSTAPTPTVSSASTPSPFSLPKPTESAALFAPSKTSDSSLASTVFQSTSTPFNQPKTAEPSSIANIFAPTKATDATPTPTLFPTPTTLQTLSSQPKIPEPPSLFSPKVNETTSTATLFAPTKANEATPKSNFFTGGLSTPQFDTFSPQKQSDTTTTPAPLFPPKKAGEPAAPLFPNTNTPSPLFPSSSTASSIFPTASSLSSLTPTDQNPTPKTDTPAVPTFFGPSSTTPSTPGISIFQPPPTASNTSSASTNFTATTIPNFLTTTSSLNFPTNPTNPFAGTTTALFPGSTAPATPTSTPTSTFAPTTTAALFPGSTAPATPTSTLFQTSSIPATPTGGLFPGIGVPTSGTDNPLTATPGGSAITSTISFNSKTRKPKPKGKR
ncbi:hypothetical protein Pelo_2304 [Pelomyxa schiedti]|nr:hypothetical protein Pelo_2304 [Pelomyxa schiedti]